MASHKNTYEIGIYANDGGWRGYIANVDTNLNVYRTKVYDDINDIYTSIRFRQQIGIYEAKGVNLIYAKSAQRLKDKSNEQ